MSFAECAMYIADSPRLIKKKKIETFKDEDELAAWLGAEEL